MESLGLDRVSQVQVIEQDKVRALTCMCINKGEKQYNVMDEEGEKMFYVVEDKDNCCQHFGCWFDRDFNLFVRLESESHDNIAKMHVHRNCCTWFSCFECCRHRMTVEQIDSTYIGHVQNNCQLCCSCYPKFTVTDAQKKPKYIVQQESHACAYFLCCGAEQRYCCGIKCYIPSTLGITSKNGAPHTMIEHLDGGRSVDADAYRVEFPEGATTEDKLLLIASTICVDYKMYRSTADDDDRPKHQQMVDKTPNPVPTEAN